MEMTSELGLKLISDKIDPKMIAHNGKHTSHTDLLFWNETSHVTHMDVKVDEMVPWNTSCHVPVSKMLGCDVRRRGNIEAVRTTQKNTSNKGIKLITKWDTLNRDVYDQCVSGYLQLMDLQRLDTASTVEIINLIIRVATLQATDMHITRGETKRRNTWPPDIVQALKRAHQYHAIWKQEGRPGPEHNVSVLLRQASRSVRASQRRHTALKREMKYKKIMDAELNDQCLFYRLVREYQSSSPGTKAIMDGDILLTDLAEAADAWAGYYAKLATPAENPRWNRTFLDQAAVEVALIKQQVTHTRMENIEDTEVMEVFKNLNKGKADDLDGIRAEHLQATSDPFAPSLSLLFTEMIQTGHTADVMKTGKKVPIPKKGKNDLLMPNHRGITITSTIGKTYEHIIKKWLGSLQQDGLQFGFSEGLSTQMAAISLTELIAQVKQDWPVHNPGHWDPTPQPTHHTSGNYQEYD